MEATQRRQPTTIKSSDDDDGHIVLADPKNNSLSSAYVANSASIVVFFSVLHYLISRWREKIRSSSPLHIVTLPELAAVAALVASFVRLLGFFGVEFVRSLLFRPNSDVWIRDDEEDQEELRKSDQHGRKFRNFVPQQLEKAVHREYPCDALDCKTTEVKSVEVSPSKEKKDQLEEIIKLDEAVAAEDEEIITSVVAGKTPSHLLETKLGDCARAAAIRREAVQRITGKSLTGLPLGGFDYGSILGQCCEMPIGYVQLPVGIAGPLVLDGVEHFVPMATTEGCLVASTNRGCKAIAISGGASSLLLRDGMTRAPVVRFGSAKRAAELKLFLECSTNFETLSAVFNSSSRFARFQGIKCTIAGKNLFLRFSCSTGDAMGMNMVSKGVQNVLDFLIADFPDMDVIGISGNYCSDKKPAAVNWIEGRGKSVVCEAVIKGNVVAKVLKTRVETLVELNMLKNLTGSAMAGALGGFNAHASNIVSAIFIATGQDPAQNVESSHCITMMEAVNEGRDLHVSVTMPSIEVGTVGGGTQLSSQSACLNLLGVRGANREAPGSNARLLATIVAGAVLAGELSLMSALAAGQLVNSHMKYNRSNKDASTVSSSGSITHRFDVQNNQNN